jgi:hypothetical protein
LYIIASYSNIIPSFKIERGRRHDIVHILATKVCTMIENNRGILVNYGEQTHKDSTCGLALKACQEHTRNFSEEKKTNVVGNGPFSLAKLTKTSPYNEKNKECNSSLT